MLLLHQHMSLHPSFSNIFTPISALQEVSALVQIEDLAAWIEGGDDAWFPLMHFKYVPTYHITTLLM
jgi:hypothetical protein